MSVKVESVVIVNSKVGSVATLRFSDSSFDRILSSTDATEKSKKRLYSHIEDIVKRATRG